MLCVFKTVLISNFKSFIVKIILLKMQVPKDANLLNSVLMFNFFCFNAWPLISNEESDEKNVWFGYDIQNTCGFHLGFHWVSKLMHVTNSAIFYWLSNVWIINEFEKEAFTHSTFVIILYFSLFQEKNKQRNKRFQISRSVFIPEVNNKLTTAG